MSSAGHRKGGMPPYRSSAAKTFGVTPMEKFKYLGRRSNIRHPELSSWLYAALDAARTPGGTEVLSYLTRRPQSDQESNPYRETLTHVCDVIEMTSRLKGSGTKVSAIQRFVLPLLQLITASNLVDCVNSSQVNQLLALVRTRVTPVVLLRYLEAVASATETKTKTQKGSMSTEDTKSESYSMLELLAPLLDYLYHLLQRFQRSDALSEDDNKAIKSILDVSVGCLSPDDHTAGEHLHRSALRRIRQRLEYIGTIMDHRAAHQLRASSSSLGRQLALPKAKRGRSPLNMTAEELSHYLPGTLRDAGPRHDNDHADIARIQIAPTQEEVLCKEKPYLPRNRPGGIYHLPTDPVSGHLDLHFRLLRHELVAPLCEAIERFRGSGGVRALQQRNDRGSRIKFKGTEADLYYYRNVQVVDIKATSFEGPYYLINFDDVPFNKARDHSVREHFWDNTRRLQRGALACLWWESPEQGSSPHLVFGCICDRNMNNLAPKLPTQRPAIGLKLCGNLWHPEVLDVAGMRDVSTERISDMREVVLLQANSNFFSHIHVLRALQSMQTFPFASLLAHPKEERAVVEEGEDPPQVGAPAYIDRQHRFDLTVLMDDKKVQGLPRIEVERCRCVLLAVDLLAPEVFPIAELLSCTTLDMGQAEALKVALTQEVAIVQGPPGTGKTYLGIQLIRVLLHNTRTRSGQDQDHHYDSGPLVGPILCVTFTNHALDSFLEGLLDVGCSNICRVGGRSKSSRLEPYSLTQVAKGERVYGAWPIHQELTDLDQKIKKKARLELLALEKKVLCWQDVAEYIQDMYPSFYLGFVEHVCCSSRTEQSEELEQVWTWWLEGGSWKQYLRSRRQQVKRRSGRKQHLAPPPPLPVSQAPLENSANQFDVLGESVDSNESHAWASVKAALAREKDVEGSTETGDGGDGGEESDGGESTIDEQEAPEHDERDDSSVSEAEGPTDLHSEPVDDPWELTRDQRMRLQQVFLDDLRKIEPLAEVMQSYEDKRHQLQEVYQDRDMQVLRRAAIVGITTSKIADLQQMVAGLRAKVVLIEEAAEVFEAHVLTSMSAETEHLILIGDHEQLRPKPEVWELQHKSGNGYDLNVSLFERLVTQKSFSFATLDEQRRMRPDIANLIRKTIYPHLRDHPLVQGYSNVRGMTQDLYSIDHDHPEGGEEENKSRYNEYEVQYAVGLARYLLLQGQFASEDITILTPYVGQLLKLKHQLQKSNLTVLMGERDKEELDKAGGEERQQEGRPVGPQEDSREASSVNKSPPDINSPPQESLKGGSDIPTSTSTVSSSRAIRAATIDNFHGEESAVVILSLVRNNPAGAIGFLKRKNRINVLLSRAKQGMYILGHKPSLCADNREGALWPRVLAMLDDAGRVGPSLEVCCQVHGNVTTIRDWKDFMELVGDGGCQLACNRALPCGHTCPRSCHCDDPDHLSVQCLKPCTRLHPCGAHPCKQLCYMDCGPCPAIVGKELPCGHLATSVPCHQDPAAVLCSALVTVQVLGCGHLLTVPCNRSRLYQTDPRSCTHPVTLVMPCCGHKVNLKCGQVTTYLEDPSLCRKPCLGTLGCSHQCQSRCGDCLGRAMTHMPVQQSFLDDFQELVVKGILPDDVEDELLWVDSRASTLQGLWDQQRGQDMTWDRFLRMKMSLGNTETWEGVIDKLPLAIRQQQVQHTSNEAEEPSELRGSDDMGARVCSYLEERPVLMLWSTWLHSQKDLVPHGECNAPCGRHLACGHTCSSTCHPPTKPCSACSRQCWIKCPHTHCHRQCSLPCFPCAEPCVWSCPHQGPCPVPCGAPCTRLPCDLRCERLLPCGHRCPSLCGEPCPAKKFCLECASQKVRDQPVDMLLMRSYGELEEADLDGDPLMVLPCGHAFLMSTMDGVMELEHYYERSQVGTSQAWGAPCRMPPEMGRPKHCPSCRAPVTGLRRYGRVTNKLVLDLVDRKHLEFCRRRLSRVQQELTTGQGILEDQKERPLSMESWARVVHGLQDVMKSFNQVCRFFNRPPKAQVHEATKASLLSTMELQLLPQPQLQAALDVLMVPKPDTTILRKAQEGMGATWLLTLDAIMMWLHSANQQLRRLKQQHPGVHPVHRGGYTRKMERDILALAEQWWLWCCGRTQDVRSLLTEAQKAAAQDRSWNMSYRLTLMMMKLVYKWLQIVGETWSLQRMKTVIEQGIPPGGVESYQLSLLMDMKAMGEAAFDAYLEQTRNFEEVWGNPAMDEVVELLGRIEETKQDIEHGSTLSLLKLALRGDDESGDSLLQGHVYQCPNGHIYTIGDCGGAVMTSRCPECGEVIGGAGHNLAAGNTRADIPEA